MTQEYIFLVWLLTLVTIFFILRDKNISYGLSLAFGTFFSYMIANLLYSSAPKNKKDIIIGFIRIATLLILSIYFMFSVNEEDKK